jgi:hypothetical protein
MSQKSKEFVVTVIAFDVSRRLRALAEPRPVGDRVKVAIQRAARATGLTYWRAYDHWYGKAKTIHAEEIEMIRRAELNKARGASRELIQFARDFEAMAERASRIDPEMVGPFADAMRDIAGRARSLANGD